MSDAPAGPGWWQASDGKWYPPEQAPGGQPAQPAQPDQQWIQPPAGGGMAPMGGSFGAGNGLDVGRALSFGFDRFKANIGILLVLVLVVVAANLVVSILFNGVIGPRVGGFVGLLIGLAGNAIGLAIAFILSKGLVKAALDLCDGIDPTPGRVFNFEEIGPYALAAIIAAAIQFVGFIFCIIPGIIAALFLYFWPYAVVDEGQGPTQALTTSFNLVKDRISEIIIFLLAVIVLNFIGALLCGIGLLVTWPTTLIATAYAWRTLRGRPPQVA